MYDMYYLLYHFFLRKLHGNHNFNCIKSAFITFYSDTAERYFRETNLYLCA